MTPHAFVSKWINAELKESAASQEQFIDLCHLLEEPTPAEADPKGEWFSFEKGALKTGGGDGWADVWKRGCFGWEYKSKGKSLDAAFAQLQRYAIALENPPLLIVSDMKNFRLHTNWTNTVQEVREFSLEALEDESQRRVLKWAFSETYVNQLKPKKTRRELTEEVAGDFAQLAQRLRDRGHLPEAVAHFVNRLVFCMFAEDVDLLPSNMFKRMLDASLRQPDTFETHSRDLFAAMKSGGPVGFERVEWFNGGLFDNDATLPLTEDDIKQTLDVARLDWSSVDPSILGTLFERGLDPGKRSQLGAHYTDRDKIMLIVNPVIVDPLTREWEEAKPKIEAQLKKVQQARGRTPKTQAEAKKTHSAARRQEMAARKEALRIYGAFLERLNQFRVLDPACGSGNFLYISLLALKDIERRATIEMEALSASYDFQVGMHAPSVGPQCVKGIEINPFAAELARISVWIGEIQWMKRNGFDASRNPILKPLETIECRDALLNPDGTEAQWPKADVIVGNPPFLGGKKMRSGGPEKAGSLGDTYVNVLREAFDRRLPDFSDYVCYWFEKARAAILNNGGHSTAGLVATNSIRGGANRVVLDRISEQLMIFDAWDDEPWVVDGAAVRVSLVSFGMLPSVPLRLDGLIVTNINPDLTSSSYNLGRSAKLALNKSVAFIGVQPSGPFQVGGTLARDWLNAPKNPGGHSNSEVLRPYWNGIDITRRNRDLWIVFFKEDTKETDAALLERPFEHLKTHVRPVRMRNKMGRARALWWITWCPRPELRDAIQGLARFIVTPRVAKHRVWSWACVPTLPDSQVVAVACDDDTTFGILHSRFHELWSLRMGTSLEDRPRYTPTTCFETFPFPEGLTPNIPASDYAGDPRAIAIAKAASKLNELREAWLNPEDLVERVPEVVPGYPDRIVPKDERAAAILKKRTLTNLYNERPAWLDHAHRALDEAVAAAYGWPADLTDDEVLERLFKLNQARAAEEARHAGN